MTEKQNENPPAVQDVIDEAARTREKYGHPSPKSTERDRDIPTTGFIRWYEKGGHLDPQSEERHPEYLALWKKLGGGHDYLELEDGTTLKRSRAPEDPEQARDLDKSAPASDTPEGERKEGELGTEPEAERKQAQGLTKTNLPKRNKTTTSKE